jgi:uncharacterized membrane protein
MQFMKRKSVLGIPVGSKRPNWGALRNVGAVGVAGVSAVAGAVAAARRKATGDDEQDMSAEENEGSEEQNGEESEAGSDDEEEDAEGKVQSRREAKLRHIIHEYVDVAVPLKSAYNQWTQFAGLPSMTKGVKSVEQDKDDVTTWAVKIGPKKAKWTAQIVEQIPDERIAWQSKSGPKHRGVVTFHRLSGNLTRVQVDMEVTPQGLLTRLGMALGSVRRRARRDLALFQHNLELAGEESGEWRGEIHTSDELARSSSGESESPEPDTSEEAPEQEASEQETPEQEESTDEDKESTDEEASGEEPDVVDIREHSKETARSES